MNSPIRTESNTQNNKTNRIDHIYVFPEVKIFFSPCENVLIIRDSRSVKEAQVVKYILSEQYAFFSSLLITLPGMIISEEDRAKREERSTHPPIYEFAMRPTYNTLDTISFTLYRCDQRNYGEILDYGIAVRALMTLEELASSYTVTISKLKYRENELSTEDSNYVNVHLVQSRLKTDYSSLNTEMNDVLRNIRGINNIEPRWNSRVWRRIYLENEYFHLRQRRLNRSINNNQSNSARVKKRTNQQSMSAGNQNSNLRINNQPSSSSGPTNFIRKSHRYSTYMKKNNSPVRFGRSAMRNHTRSQLLLRNSDQTRDDLENNTRMRRASNFIVGPSATSHFRTVDNRAISSVSMPSNIIVHSQENYTCEENILNQPSMSNQKITPYPHTSSKHMDVRLQGERATSNILTGTSNVFSGISNISTSSGIPNQSSSHNNAALIHTSSSLYGQECTIDIANLFLCLQLFENLDGSEFNFNFSHERIFIINARNTLELNSLICQGSASLPGTSPYMGTLSNKKNYASKNRTPSNQRTLLTQDAAVLNLNLLDSNTSKAINLETIIVPTKNSKGYLTTQATSSTAFPSTSSVIPNTSGEPCISTSNQSLNLKTITKLDGAIIKSKYPGLELYVMKAKNKEEIIDCIANISAEYLSGEAMYTRVFKHPRYTASRRITSGSAKPSFRETIEEQQTPVNSSTTPQECALNLSKVDDMGVLNLTTVRIKNNTVNLPSISSINASTVTSTGRIIGCFENSRGNIFENATKNKPRYTASGFGRV